MNKPTNDRETQHRTPLLGAGILGLSLGLGPTGMSALADPPTSTEVEAALQRANDLSIAFEKVAADASPAVVNITASKQVAGPGDDDMDLMFRRFFGQRGMERTPQLAQSLGSGVIVSNDGYILTNNHVIEGASLVTVKLGDNASYTARIVGADPATDIAVLKVEGERLPAVKLADSDKVRVGEWVMAIGNPFGLDQTVTAGIVSAKGRTQRAGGLQEVQYQDFIQTDASINPGNSGGPLLNLRGEIVGINSAILSRAGGSIGIGFAIPANLARSVMDSLIATGEVRRSWLGVFMQDLNPDLAKSFEFPGVQGVLVSDVAPSSPAAIAGFRPGDIITRYDGRPVANRDALQNLVGVTPPGKTVDVEFHREGKPASKRVAVTQRDPSQVVAVPEVDVLRSLAAEGGLGIEGQSVTPEIAEKLRDRKALGVVVTKVEKRSAAEMVGIVPGDVVTSLNNFIVRDAAEFREAIKRIDLARGVRIGVRSNGVPQYRYVRVGR
ncbi:MAG: Do family serine endopeptidase [Phycisphaerales bacterium]